MRVLGNLSHLLTELKDRYRYHIKCERCLSGEIASYRVLSDEINIRVCHVCAEEARRIGLTVKPLNARKRAA